MEMEMEMKWKWRRNRSIIAIRAILRSEESELYEYLKVSILDYLDSLPTRLTQTAAENAFLEITTLHLDELFKFSRLMGQKPASTVTNAHFTDNWVDPQCRNAVMLFNMLS